MILYQSTFNYQNYGYSRTPQIQTISTGTQEPHCIGCKIILSQNHK